MKRHYIMPRIARGSVRAVSQPRTAVFAAATNLPDTTEPASSTERDASVIELDEMQAAARQRELASGFIVEEERLRWHGLLHPLAQTSVPNVTLPHGFGATVELFVSLNGQPLAGVFVDMNLVALRGSFMTTSNATTDVAGRAALLYDSMVWVPYNLTVTPRSRAWSSYAVVTGPRMTLVLSELPRAGPLGWWHYALGLSRYSADLGSGIRVGIIDTGIGPHPYLEHAKLVGSIVAGVVNTSTAATEDVAEHGTHIAGIIGARPTDQRDFAGIAPGADLVALRVYPGGGAPGAEAGFATNGDISLAITQLSDNEACDLINLSSGGLLRSEIENDRIVAAFNRGTLVVCSAGNGSGPPVLFPAADPSAIGVSALGVLNGVPPVALDILSMPMQADHYTAAGAYLAAFSSFGPEIKCIGPGVGIISTVPTRGDAQPAYLAGSGTSMAAPAVTGALAALLSRDATYKSLPRNGERALWAWNVLARALRPLGLWPVYQGSGLPAIMTT